MATRKSRPRASKKDAAAGDSSKDAPKTSVRVKVTSMGEGGAGKSCLIKRYCEGKFVRRYISTIGVDYGVKPVQRKGGKTVKVNFWDLSGHPEFFEVRNEFYKDTQAALLVYDVSSRQSFEALDAWMDEAYKFGVSESAVFVVCANKMDKGQFTVPTVEGQMWAESRGFEFFETSAADGTNVDAVFEHIFSCLVKD